MTYLTALALFKWAFLARGPTFRQTQALPLPRPLALTNWSKVEAGVGWCLSIKTDGTLWGWGNNDSGQLLDGTTTLRNSPIQIGSATNWVQVSAGSNFAISTLQGSSN